MRSSPAQQERSAIQRRRRFPRHPTRSQLGLGYPPACQRQRMPPQTRRRAQAAAKRRVGGLCGDISGPSLSGTGCAPNEVGARQGRACEAMRVRGCRRGDGRGAWYGALSDLHHPNACTTTGDQSHVSSGCHIRTGTGLAPAHICAGAGLAAAPSAPGIGTYLGVPKCGNGMGRRLHR